ncbi:MAG: hypothetical protein ABIA93_00125 [Candidatus Woesearchaeota archaeon]
MTTPRFVERLGNFVQGRLFASEKQSPTFRETVETVTNLGEHVISVGAVIEDGRRVRIPRTSISHVLGILNHTFSPNNERYFYGTIRKYAGPLGEVMVYIDVRAGPIYSVPSNGRKFPLEAKPMHMARIRIAAEGPRLSDYLS